MPIPPMEANCDAGDVATGGGAIREGATFPIQDMPAYPVPRNVLTAPTGWSTTTWMVGAGDTITLMVVCADLP